MEKRIGGAIILVNKKESISKLNTILSQHADIIIGRQGIPYNSRTSSVISIVLEGTTDKIGSLTGQLGRLDGVSVKSMVFKKNAKKT